MNWNKEGHKSGCRFAGIQVVRKDIVGNGLKYFKSN